MSFLDAAEKILRDSGSNEAMSYVEITSRAIEAGLIRPEGQTPAASLSAQVGVDIRRREERGERPRFSRPERGKIGLAPDLPVGVADQIEEQNRHVQAQLLARARGSSPDGFEQLVAALLEAMGFEDVEVTSRSGDGGIDVRGTLVVADVVRLRMAVQAKRWKQNVQKPVVQQVRGSLGAHEQGLIITTSGFSKGAREEAERSDASPVALMNGEQLARLLAEKEIGAERTKYDLWTLLD
ncbi:MAG: restriction endonuclease [Holophagales bacterium]|nr:restriction endonuclease [Holophagales bacterium]MYF96577.1 restriction endonuclease [Holophagales bacterium]